MIPKRSFRQSRLISVVFPDKRASALRKRPGGNDSLHPTLSNNSVIDIKAAGGPRPSIDAASHLTSVADVKVDPEAFRNAPSESLVERARTPTSRWSNASCLSKISKHLSSFSSSSAGMDLERGVVERADMVQPPVPALPKFVPGPVSPPKSHLREARLSNEPPPPAINVIPASVSRTMSLDQRALHSRSGSLGSTGSTSYKALALLGQSVGRGSPPNGRVGLPGNPRAYRSN